MKALVYQGTGGCALRDAPRPAIERPTDAIVRVTKTTLCGADLRLLQGEVPGVLDGRILGHEGVGVVEEAGQGVSCFREGDRVLISCILSCGRCALCQRGMHGHCARGGRVLGHFIDGTQAEFVRVPFADSCLHAIPPAADEEAEEALVMLGDILPASGERGVMCATVSPGDTVAIIGAGPAGLAALLSAQMYLPSEIIVVDVDQSRLRVSKTLGATRTVDNTNGAAIDQVMALTQGCGVDVAIEAVGISASLDICERIVARSGRINCAGALGKRPPLNLDRLWSHDAALSTRLSDVVTTPLLMKAALAGQMAPLQAAPRRFRLDDILAAYDTFGPAARESGRKVLIING